MTTSRRSRGTPSSLLTLTTLVGGGGGLAALILLLRALPAIAYRLHLPLWTFYALLIGGGVAAFFLGRRLASRRAVQPGRTPTLDDVALRHLPAAMLAFKTLPILVVAAVAAWLVVYEHVTVILFWAALAFTIVWRMAWASLWKLLFWRR